MNNKRLDTILGYNMKKFNPNNNKFTYEAIMAAMKQAVNETEKDKHLNMQYYMEYCQANGYVTPKEWLENHKHF